MDEIVKVLLTGGLTSGVVIAVLLIAVYKLYQRNQELHTTLYVMGKESTSANVSTAAALNRLSDLLQARSDSGR